MCSHAGQEKQITETTNLRNERRDTSTDLTDTEEIECSSLIHPKWMSESNKFCKHFFPIYALL